MRKTTWMPVAVALIVLLLGGSPSASNMGFKLNYPLYGPGTFGSSSGLQTLALPFHQQTNLYTAADLMADINSTAGGPAVASIQRFLKQSDELIPHSGGPLDIPTDFPLVAGEGYRVQVKSDVNYLIVGSHDPELIINLDGPGTNGSNSGLNLYAYPYHSIASTALAEIDAQSADSNAVVSIQRFLKESDELVSYSGGPLDLPADFALVPSQAIPRASHLRRALPAGALLSRNPASPIP